MKQTILSPPVFRLLGIGSLCLISLPLSSCSSSSRERKEALRRAQEKAHAVRSAFHRDQQARDYALNTTIEDREPTNEVRFFRVPVEEHLNEDGLLIEAHQRTVEIVQP